MYQDIYYYNLYCINMRCQISIYKINKEIEMALTIENLTKTHICVNCCQQLVSAMDIDLEQITSQAGIKIQKKTDYITGF
jgi:hypothetical protein